MINLKPINKLKYKAKDSLLLLQVYQKTFDPVAMVNVAIWVFVGICLGILGCYLIIN